MLREAFDRRGELLRGKKRRPDASHRSPTTRDRDRVLYSTAFRRLEGVTQVFSPNPTADVHNRLTHSLRVEQLGSAITGFLTEEFKIDVDESAVRAGCLAHDLGHPPFGHSGEEKLNSLVTCCAHRKKPQPHKERLTERCEKCLLPDGFEGNAQSFRVLSKLEIHTGDPGMGLDLTRTSLAASAKYPWLRGNNGNKPEKWGAYDDDAEAFEFATNSATPTIEAQIMDWADDIAYAVHDIEDYFRAGLIPLNEYVNDTGTRRAFFEYITAGGRVSLDPASEQAACSLFQFFPTTKFAGSSSDLRKLDDFRTRFITHFIDHTRIDDHGNLDPDPMVQKVNSIIKQFTWFHIIDHHDLAIVQKGQQEVLSRIFQTLVDQLLDDEMWLSGYEAAQKGKEWAKGRRIPIRLIRCLESAWQTHSGGDPEERIVYRAVVDFIAGLTDARAYQIDALLHGRDLQSFDTVNLQTS